MRAKLAELDLTADDMAAAVAWVRAPVHASAMVTELTISRWAIGRGRESTPLHYNRPIRSLPLHSVRKLSS